MIDPQFVPKKHHFPKVREARAALSARALEIQELYIQTAKAAIEAEKFEEALKALQWLQEHMPQEDGITMIDPSIDKPKQIEGGHKGPTIQIGIALGGTKSGPKVLTPTPLIEVDELKDPIETPEDSETVETGYKENEEDEPEDL